MSNAGKMMTPEAIEARRAAARALLERYPDIETTAVCQRTGVGKDYVLRLRREAKKGRP